MLYISVSLQLVLSAAVASWSVSYSPKSICVFERSSVDFSCSFDYIYTLQKTKWFRPEKTQKQDGSQQGISVYHSDEKEIDQRYRNRTMYAKQSKNCSLQLHNVSRNDIGIYFFRFETNAYRGQYTGSGGIYLNVAVLPFRVTVDKKQHICEGDSVTLSCGTGNCTPTRGPFAWFKNHILLPQTTKNELRIASVTHNDFGYYSCGLKNSTPGDEILLDIRYSPKNVEITVLSSGEIQEGNTVTLVCKSDANPAATNYTWFKIRDANTSSIGVDPEFVISAASEQDRGQYFCTATNYMGSKESTVITLEVKERSHRQFLLSATAVFLFAAAVILLLFGFIIRRKRFMSKKQPTEQTPIVTVMEEIYVNVRKPSEEITTTILYADLRLPPATSDRPHYNIQEDNAVIYSILSYNK